jgi:predicted acetyltransferase
MAEGLRRAAEDGLPAFLETSKPENVGFYRRSGWEVAAEFDEPLHTWVMRQ